MMNNHAVDLYQPESELMIHHTSTSSANAAEQALSAPSAVDDPVVRILLEAYERGRELNAAAATPLSETSAGSGTVV